MADDATTNTKDRILDAGARAIVAKSYNGCGLNEILCCAGVPKGSFYHYFKSKEALGVAVIERSAEDHVERLREYVTDRSVPPLDRIKGFFSGWKTCYASSGPNRECLIAKLALETAQLSEPMRAAIKCWYDQWSAMLAKAIREAQAEGQVDPEMDADLLADQLVNGWEGATIRMQIDRDFAPLDQFVDIVLERMLRA